METRDSALFPVSALLAVVRAAERRLAETPSAWRQAADEYEAGLREYLKSRPSTPPPEIPPKAPTPQYVLALQSYYANYWNEYERLKASIQSPSAPGPLVPSYPASRQPPDVKTKDRGLAISTDTAASAEARMEELLIEKAKDLKRINQDAEIDLRHTQRPLERQRIIAERDRDLLDLETEFQKAYDQARRSLERAKLDVNGARRKEIDDSTNRVVNGTASMTDLARLPEAQRQGLLSQMSPEDVARYYRELATTVRDSNRGFDSQARTLDEVARQYDAMSSGSTPAAVVPPGPAVWRIICALAMRLDYAIKVERTVYSQGSAARAEAANNVRIAALELEKAIRGAFFVLDEAEEFVKWCPTTTNWQLWLPRGRDWWIRPRRGPIVFSPTPRPLTPTPSVVPGPAVTQTYYPQAQSQQQSYFPDAPTPFTRTAGLPWGILSPAATASLTPYGAMATYGGVS